jgi:hypothetical protein
MLNICRALEDQFIWNSGTTQRIFCSVEHKLFYCRGFPSLSFIIIPVRKKIVFFVKKFYTDF